MKFKFKNAVLPCNEKTDFNGIGDIVCRIYLSAAPCKKFEKIAKEIDEENYSPDCFFIETFAGRDKICDEFTTGGWYLFYIDYDGNCHEIDYVHDIMEDKAFDAWEFIEKEIGVEFYGTENVVIY